MQDPLNDSDLNEEDYAHNNELLQDDASARGDYEEESKYAGIETCIP
jgi:hypothetical protein